MNTAMMNDIFRKNMNGTTQIPGRIVITATLSSDENLPEIIEAVRSFSHFTESNDPHQEHDFGRVTVDHEEYFWKIDYYAIKDGQPDFHAGAEDPLNSFRIMTIMRADEY